MANTRPCPDDCRRGSTSRYMMGPIRCGSCGGIRTDLHAEIAVREKSVERAFEWENAWAREYGSWTIHANPNPDPYPGWGLLRRGPGMRL